MVPSNERARRKNGRVEREPDYKKVLSFIATEDSEITKADIHYLFQYPDQFGNVSIFHVSHSIFMSTLFVCVDEFDSHNKFNQSDLALKKCWVTQCSWLQWRETVSMVMTITNIWKLFFMGLKAITMTNWLVSENYWNEFLLISSIILLQLTPGNL